MGDHLRSFNVSFISRYPSEDERLFIGGFWRIRVQSIKLLKTKQNFSNFIAPLYYLDAMITGAYDFPKYPKNAKGVIDHLFQYKLGQNPEAKMDNYLYETFDAFVQNKEHIVIDLLFLRNAKESMYKLITHSIEQGEELKDDSDKTNLIQSVFAAIFKKAETVYIDATLCSFSLIGFLCVLQESEWQKVIIKAGWISDLWQSSKRACIEQKYSSKMYKISHVEKNEHIVVVVRM